MKVIHMIDDYRTLCKEAVGKGAYKAYEDYTKKYSAFFDGVFNFLYQCPMEALRELIEKVDFNALLDIAEGNYSKGVCDKIVNITERFAGKMKVDFDFELILGCEMSNIGGCSVPPLADGIPKLYIGIDKELDKDSLDFIIPHEMYHLIHQQLLTQEDFEGGETLAMRTVEEGLASFTPLWLYDLDWNEANVARTLWISEDDAHYLMTHTEEILEKALPLMNEVMTPEVYREYFTRENPEDPCALPGYYIGLYMAQRAVKEGFDFTGYANTRNEQIAKMWDLTT